MLHELMASLVKAGAKFSTAFSTIEKRVIEREELIHLNKVSEYVTPAVIAILNFCIPAPQLQPLEKQEVKD